MSDTFKKALLFTLTWEGGYVNDPDDSGGATNKGITNTLYQQYLFDTNQKIKNVKDITSLEAENIYFRYFWLPLHADGLDPKLAIASFDWAVNSGVSRVIPFLKSGSDYSKLIEQRESFYRTIGVGKRAKFLKGWLNRVTALKEYLRSL